MLKRRMNIWKRWQVSMYSWVLTIRGILMRDIMILAKASDITKSSVSVCLMLIILKSTMIHLVILKGMKSL